MISAELQCLDVFTIWQTVVHRCINTIRPCKICSAKTLLHKQSGSDAVLSSVATLHHRHLQSLLLRNSR